MSNSNQNNQAINNPPLLSVANGVCSRHGKLSDNGKCDTCADNEYSQQYSEACRFVIENNRASISGIQRKFKLGFNRAARLIENMEQDGIVSPPNSEGKREVYSVT